MIVREQPALHLTYCLNVHPGETWAENLDAIREKAGAVRRRIAPGSPFGLGLRLSRQAAEELAAGDRLSEFRDVMESRGLYAFTINGFPYGRFHGAPVKAEVYAPDWRTPERCDYTCLLADLLAELLPAGVTGSISTVPVSYKPWAIGESGVEQACRMLCDTVAHLAQIRDRTGVEIHIGLEPEPDCLVETTAEAVAFFDGPLAKHGLEHLRKQHGLGRSEAREILDRHVGICVDTAHAAVEFERPAEVLAKFAQKGIRVSKIQLSSALRVRVDRGARSLEELRAFCD